MFSVYLRRRALKWLEGQPRDVRERVLRLVERLARGDEHVWRCRVKRLRGTDLLRAEEGPIRVIFRVDYSSRVLRIERIVFRERAY